MRMETTTTHVEQMAALIVRLSQVGLVGTAHPTLKPFARRFVETAWFLEASLVTTETWLMATDATAIAG